jgi:predicted metal-dependent enzyme (double-stranded beta helix superfamily)
MSDDGGGHPGFSRRKLLALGAGAMGGALLATRVAAAAAPKQSSGNLRLDLDRFVEDCVRASQESDPQTAVREVLARAVSDPKAALRAIGEPSKAGLNVFHRSPTLTIFSATWTPQMNLMPHNHLMWALIGIYTGREDNILWRKADGSIEAFGAKALFEGDIAALPVDVIHSVTNPLPRFTGGVHIYGGDFFAIKRSQWNPETLAVEPSDGDAIKAIFERENARLPGAHP